MATFRALLVDYGGVLTNPLQETMSTWAESDGIDAGEFGRVLRDWLGEDAGRAAVAHPGCALERGELAVPDFERQLAARLRTRDGRAVPAAGLLDRMFAGFRREPQMVHVVRRIRASGIATALLSNSWSLDYPRDDWEELFDAAVISGEVGMRKPEPRIYRYTAELLGVAPEECVFVDDLPSNVSAAVDVGMVGITHRTADETIGELEARFDLRLCDDRRTACRPG